MTTTETEKPQVKSGELYTGPVARPDGSLPNALDMVRGIDEIFDTGEEGELSFMRGALRCLGHCAIGTPEEDIPEDGNIPAVSPWKLMSALTKAAVSKDRRREMMGRIKEGMSIGDSMGLLAVLSIYDAGKHSGMNKEQARDNAWGWYGKSGGSQPKSPPA
jgi:hypothetical protein